MRRGELHKMNDFDKAQLFEVTVDDNGKCWVNVDGVCMVRIQLAHHVQIDLKGTTILSLTEGKKDGGGKR